MQIWKSQSGRHTANWPITDTGPVEQLVYWEQWRKWGNKCMSAEHTHASAIISYPSNHNKTQIALIWTHTHTGSHSLQCVRVCLSETEQLLQSQGSHCPQYEADHKDAPKRLQFSVIDRRKRTTRGKRRRRGRAEVSRGGRRKKSKKKRKVGHQKVDLHQCSPYPTLNTQIHVWSYWWQSSGGAGRCRLKWWMRCTVCVCTSVSVCVRETFWSPGCIDWLPSTSYTFQITPLMSSVMLYCSLTSSCILSSPLFILQHLMSQNRRIRLIRLILYFSCSRQISCEDQTRLWVSSSFNSFLLTLWIF